MTEISSVPGRTGGVQVEVMDVGGTAPTLGMLALIRRGGVDSVIAVEFVDLHGRTLPASDAGAGFISFTVSSTARTLGYHIDATDNLTGVSKAGLPNGAVGAIIYVVSGEINFNTSGNADGDIGATNGLTSAALAPTTSTSTPDFVSAGGRMYFGRVNR